MTTTSSPTDTTHTPRARAAAPGVDATDAAIDLACRTLQLPTIRHHYDELATTALRQRASYKRFLADLLDTEVTERAERRKLRLVHEAGFARPKRIEDFNYAANPTISPELIANLTDPAWVRNGHPAILLGDSGTGKSHLLIGIGTAIAEAGLKVRYSTCANLVNELVEAADERHLSRTITRYGKVDLLCIDEFGYLELDPAGAKLLFQIFTEREERRSIAVASNAPFSEWQRTFTDPRLCAAIVDRLTFNGHIIETGSDSYRLATTRAARHPH
jgi:DNA replication protein DnaC